MPDETLEQFGRYSLIRRLAFGGMAEIFLAAMKGDEGFEKRVVLKRILPQFSADPAFVSMFTPGGFVKIFHDKGLDVPDEYDTLYSTEEP